jgi:ParB family chromosome partitioning protein
LRDEGWTEVLVLPRGAQFMSWDHEQAGRRKGGRVYVEVRSSGEVVFHEGWLTRSETRARERGEAGEPAKIARPEASGPLNTYIDLHRHAAVRAALTGHPGIALRLMVAHAIAGSTLWRVEPEPQASRNEAITESVAACRGESVFAERRRAVLDLLGFDAERTSLTRRFGQHEELPGLFLRLLALPDAALLDVIAVVMGESLAAGCVAVEAAGAACRVDMADWWQADDALFDLIRDRAVMEAVTSEVAGELVARGNAGEPARTLKRIVRDNLDGRDGRTKVERWVPRWMAFPPAAYTGRGGVGSVSAHRRYTEAGAEPQDGEVSPGRLAA